MYSNFEYTSTLQYRVKNLKHQLEAFESGEKYVKMQSEFKKQLAESDRTIKRLKSELSAARAQAVDVRNKWMEIVDDLEHDHTKAMEASARRLRAMEERALRTERQRDKALDELAKTRRALEQTLTELAEEKGNNLKLTAQINRDYENSSKASSEKPLHKKIHNSREKSGKRPGGQPGHTGHKRKKLKSDKPPVLIPTPPKVTLDPDYYPTGNMIFKQVIGLKLCVEVTDYYTPEYRRRSTGTRYHAPFPSGVNNEVNYDPSVKAFAFLLNNDCNASIEKTQAFISDATDGAVHLSAGMINGLGRVFSAKTENERKKIFASLLQAPVMYSDATVGRVNADGKAVIVCASDHEVQYFFKDKKGHDGLIGTPVEDYQQTLVHDHDTTYYSYGKDHQECLAHILRSLKDSMENEPNLTWSTEMHAFLRKMIHEVKAANRQVSESDCQAYERAYDKILETAQEEYEAHPPSKYYREGFNLQTRMSEFKENHLFFLRHPEVGYTNNTSERYLRKYKRKQKQAVTFRSQRNAEAFCDALGVIETGKLKGKSAYTTAMRVFES